MLSIRSASEFDVVGERNREVAIGWFTNVSFAIRAVSRVVRDDERAWDEPAFKQARGVSMSLGAHGISFISASPSASIATASDII